MPIYAKPLQPPSPAENAPAGPFALSAYERKAQEEEKKRKRSKAEKKCGMCGTFHVPNAPKCFSCSAAQKAMLGMCETPVDVVGTTLTRLVGARIRKDAQERIGAIQVYPVTFQAFFGMHQSLRLRAAKKGDPGLCAGLGPLKRSKDKRKASFAISTSEALDFVFGGKTFPPAYVSPHVNKSAVQIANGTVLKIRFPCIFQWEGHGRTHGISVARAMLKTGSIGLTTEGRWRGCAQLAPNECTLNQAHLVKLLDEMRSAGLMLAPGARVVVESFLAAMRAQVPSTSSA